MYPEVATTSLTGHEHRCQLQSISRDEKLIAYGNIVTQRRVKRLQCASRIVLRTIEASINHPLNSVTQRLKQGSNSQCRPTIASPDPPCQATQDGLENKN